MFNMLYIMNVNIHTDGPGADWYRDRSILRICSHKPLNKLTISHQPCPHEHLHQTSHHKIENASAKGTWVQWLISTLVPFVRWEKVAKCIPLVVLTAFLKFCVPTCNQKQSSIHSPHHQESPSRLWSFLWQFISSFRVHDKYPLQKRQRAEGAALTCQFNRMVKVSFRSCNVQINQNFTLIPNLQSKCNEKRTYDHWFVQKYTCTGAKKNAPVHPHVTRD